MRLANIRIENTAFGRDVRGSQRVRASEYGQTKRERTRMLTHAARQHSNRKHSIRARRSRQPAGSCQRVRLNQTGKNPHAHACGLPTFESKTQHAGETFAAASGFAPASTAKPNGKEPACSRMRLANIRIENTAIGRDVRGSQRVRASECGQTKRTRTRMLTHAARQLSNRKHMCDRGNGHTSTCRLQNHNRPGGIRTPDQGIMSPLL